MNILILVVSLLVYAGYGIFSLITWAMITDVIDDTEIKTGQRSDGTVYAVYSFSRKMGQASATGLYGLLLSMIGYSAETAFEPAVTKGIYDITCLVPLMGFVVLGVVLKFMYPLDKETVLANAKKLEEKYR